MDEFRVTGRCSCGAVRYTVIGRALSVEHCHCSKCRHAHGTLVASGALIRRGQLRIDAVEGALASFESSPGNHRRFCGTCGSQLFVVIDHIPELIYYWVGTLDDGAHPGHPEDRESHIFVASGAPWERIEESLPRHAALAPDIGPGAPDHR